MKDLQVLLYAFGLGLIFIGFPANIKALYCIQKDKDAKSAMRLAFFTLAMIFLGGFLMCFSEYILN